ncbi:MAG: FAD-binding oxidoreductase [Hyphomicrobiales bacterium]|nr:FAD-binding oxidoreductase [Hyphomicrobiales bacterium]
MPKLIDCNLANIRPMAAMGRSFDFIVVGAGIAGASAAFALSRHGRVALLEMESQPGFHSTSRSAAVLSCAYGPRSWQILSAASAIFYAEPLEGFTDVALARPLGALYLAASHEERGLKAQAADLAVRGVACELVSAETARRMVPVVHMEKFTLGLHEPGCVDLDANALLHGYLRQARRNGAETLVNAEAAVITRSCGVWRVATRREALEAPILVNAAGAWADEITARAGLPRRGLRPLRRTAITFALPAGHDVRKWPMTFDVGETWYFKPEGADIMVSPADLVPTEPCDAQPDAYDVAVAIDRIESVTSMKVDRPKSRWAGLRTFAPDHEAVIGPDPEEPSFIWYAGQGGNGVMASQAAGEVCAALAIGEDIPETVARFGLTTDMIAPCRLRPL